MVTTAYAELNRGSAASVKRARKPENRAAKPSTPTKKIGKVSRGKKRNNERRMATSVQVCIAPLHGRRAEADVEAVIRRVEREAAAFGVAVAVGARRRARVLILELGVLAVRHMEGA